MALVRLKDFNINNSGEVLVTDKIQEILNNNTGNTIIFDEGKYLVSSLFIKSDTKIVFENAYLIATTDETKYPVLDTRVAGIEMPWYVGVLNVIDQSNVEISGTGTIDGSGPYWWNKYWGNDMHGGMRAKYDKLGLRFACDYDCRRIRNLVVSNSSNIKISDISSIDSGFWNVHILYSHDVVIDNIKIKSDDTMSPATDGINIDSSYDVEVKNCTLACNDDSICIKSGRDADGIKVNKPSHDVNIHDCKILSGFGITIGSELSGGVYNIHISNIKYEGTDCGFRIKSTKTRKGYIKHITISNLEMINVKYLFHFYLNWNPSYSTCKIPKGYIGEVPAYWNTLCEKVDSSILDTVIEDIDISNVKAYQTSDYKGLARAFNIEGFENQIMSKIKFRNIDATVKEFGIISYANVSFENTNINVLSKNNPLNDVYDNR